MCQMHETTDGPNGFFKRSIVQRTDIREKIVLPPNYYLQSQWDGGSGSREQILNRKWRNPDEIMPTIRKAPSLDAMRFTREAKRLYNEYAKDVICIHGLHPES